MTTDPDLSFAISESGEALLHSTATLTRAKWLETNFRRDDIYFFQDGVFSKLLFSEILECYIGGRDIAVIVLGFSFIERSIAGRLAHTGSANASALSGEELLEAARDRQWISVGEQQELNEVRKIRNPIVHFKNSLHMTRPEIKSLMAARTTKEMLERDAKQVLKAAIRMLSKTAV